MTTLTQLVEHYCPDGVKYVKLGNVIELNPGTRITKARNTGTMFPVYGGGGVSFYTDDSNRSDEWVISRFAMSPHCFRYVSGKFWLLDSGITFAVRGEQNKQYIAHFLSSIQPLIYATSSKSAQRNLRIKDFLKLEIPLPPREVQDAIVERLDAFAALIESLDSEITLREKRFEHFREQLLAFDDSAGVEYVKLGEPLKLKAGRYIKASEISDQRSETHRYICVGGNGVRGFVSTHNQHGAYAVIGRQGALCGNVQWFSGDFYATEHAVVVTPEEEVCGRFMFHQLVEMNLRQYATKSAQPGLSVNKLNELPIAIPSLEVQQNIADKLDAMQALIDNLEKERDLRKSQFEYYREKLLTFNS